MNFHARAHTTGHATCTICGKTFEDESFDYVCPDHGSEGILDIQYDYDRIRSSYSRKDLEQNSDPTIWRYKPLLPVNSDSPTPPLSVGGTPLYDLDGLAQDLGVAKFYLKDDGRLPTASFKDRASALAVVKAQERKAGIITTASTGPSRPCSAIQLNACAKWCWTPSRGTSSPMA